VGALCLEELLPRHVNGAKIVLVFRARTLHKEQKTCKHSVLAPNHQSGNCVTDPVKKTLDYFNHFT
jgi:hypothetical protein